MLNVSSSLEIDTFNDNPSLWSTAFPFSESEK